MKTFAAGLVVGTAMLLGGALAYLEMGWAQVAADEPPTGWIGRFLYSSVHAAVRRHAPKQENPLGNDEQVLIAGGKLYLNDCVGCHGEPGKPPSEFGVTFYPQAPQLAQNATEYTEAEIFWVAKHGIRRTGMSAQGVSYGDADLWRLARFIRHMTELSPRVKEAIQPPPATGSTDK